MISGAPNDYSVVQLINDITCIEELHVVVCRVNVTYKQCERPAKHLPVLTCLQLPGCAMKRVPGETSTSLSFREGSTRQDCVGGGEYMSGLCLLAGGEYMSGLCLLALLLLFWMY